jgi:hypothetical protein
MNGVKFSGFFWRKLDHFQGLDLESLFDDTIQNSSAVSITESVGLDHGKGSVAHG